MKETLPGTGRTTPRVITMPGRRFLHAAGIRMGSGCLSAPGRAGRNRPEPP